MVWSCEGEIAKSFKTSISKAVKGKPKPITEKVHSYKGKEQSPYLKHVLSILVMVKPPRMYQLQEMHHQDCLL